MLKNESGIMVKEIIDNSGYRHQYIIDLEDMTADEADKALEQIKNTVMERTLYEI